MHEYELIYIKRIGVGGDTEKKVGARIAKAFERHGGILLREKDLGEKPLAYIIQKEQNGIYHQLNFLGHGGLVDEIENQLRMLPEVLRFLTIRLSRDVDPEVKKEEYAKAEAAEKEQVPQAETEAGDI